MAGAEAVSQADVIPVQVAQRKLVVLWLICSGVLFSTLLVQSLLGHFGSRVSDAWGWFVPLLVPTLGLMIGAIVNGGAGRMPETTTVSRFIFQLTYGTSCMYLIVITVTILSSPIAHAAAGILPLDLMKTSQLWLVPLQTLTTGALGALFTSIKTQETAA